MCLDTNERRVRTPPFWHFYFLTLPTHIEYEDEEKKLTNFSFRLFLCEWNWKTPALTRLSERSVLHSIAAKAPRTADRRRQ